MAETDQPDRIQATSRTAGAKADHEAAEVRVGWRMAGIGMQVASEVVAGVLLGLLVDWWRGHGNIGVIVGSAAGIAVGLWSMISNGLKLNRELDRTAPLKGRGKPIPPKEQDQAWNEQGKFDDDDWNNDDDRPHPKRSA